MRSIEVEGKKLIFQVSEEVVLGFTRILLQVFDRIWHCVSLAAFGVARAIVLNAMNVSMSCSCLPCAFGLVIVAAAQ